MFLNISASAPTSFPRSDCYYQFGICHVITFAVFIYTYICTPIWFFSHTNGISSHYFLTCFLYLINNMSRECRSIVQNPEILNYAYFLQSTTLFCALTGKHLFFLQEALLLWNLSPVKPLLYFFFVVLIFLLLHSYLTSSSVRKENGLFIFIPQCLAWGLAYRSSGSTWYMIVFTKVLLFSFIESQMPQVAE